MPTPLATRRGAAQELMAHVQQQAGTVRALQAANAKLAAAAEDTTLAAQLARAQVRRRSAACAFCLKVVRYEIGESS